MDGLPLPGQALMSLQGDVGQVYRIQTSTNLETWTDMLMVTNRTGTIEFTDPIRTNTCKFYRAVLVR